MERITQDMRFRQSLMRYAERYGVARASRRYDKSPSYIYFWRKRWDGSIESLQPKSRRPHHHPNQHTEAELKLIRDMRRRNPKLGVVELWHRLRKRGYTRHVYSLYRVLHRLDMLPAVKEKRKYVPKTYQQMTHPANLIFRAELEKVSLTLNQQNFVVFHILNSDSVIPPETKAA